MKLTTFVETIDQDEERQQEDDVGPAKAQNAIDCRFTNNTKLDQRPASQVVPSRRLATKIEAEEKEAMVRLSLQVTANFIGREHIQPLRTKDMTQDMRLIPAKACRSGSGGP
jgi:hypothetical protein